MLSKKPEASNYDLSSLKNIASGAAPLSREVQNECAKRFNVNISQGWGMTEVTCAGISNPSGVHDSPESVGMLLPNCEARLVDERGNDVREHERGELLIRGPNISPGYWRNEAASSQTMLLGG